MEIEQLYPEGSWIVHNNYGVGKVVRLEEKHLEGSANLYYRVEGNNGTFWVPADHPDSERLRSIASRKKMESAIQSLGETPQPLDSNHIQRKAQIKEVLSSGSIHAIAGLVRDLTAFSSGRKLGIPEQEMLESLKGRLVAEWSLVMGVDSHTARAVLERILNQHRK